MEFFKPGRQFDFMGQRKFWITLSIVARRDLDAFAFWPAIV